MSEHIFSCPNCRQEISCDAAWAGQQVQCPLCQTPVTVPQSQGAPPPPQPKLAIGRAQQQADASARSKPVYRQLVAPPPKKESGVLKWAKVVVVLAGLGVGAYYGYGWYTKDREAANASPGGTPTNPANPDVPGVAAAEAGGVAAPKPAEKELPLIPATWTLDLAAASIPEGRANGTISGTNFVVETARLDFVGTAYLLSLRQGGVSPDREIQVFLRPKAGQPLTNQTWTVAKDMKGPVVPQVVKRWKTNPKYAPRQKAFSSGYAMKLELGKMSEEGISGKIFLALPDAEQSVVAGVFKAVVGLPGAVSPATATQPTVPNPEMPPNPDFQRRYGVKR